MFFFCYLNLFIHPQISNLNGIKQFLIQCAIWFFLKSVVVLSSSMYESDNEIILFLYEHLKITSLIGG